MMKTQEQSFLNQTAVSLPLNPATIHAGQLSYPLYKATKTLKEKVKPLPFNSSASRVSTHFSSEASSQIVGYTDVFKQE
jgi:putative effector of murein hydrolase